MTPKVSICVPAYRNTHYLRRCLNSIRRQSFEDYEVVVTDDSAESDVEVLCGRENLGGRLRYHRNPRPLGSPENWNEGLRRARGEYVKILHYDDWFASPGSLEQFVSFLDKNPQAAFAFCSTTDCDDRCDPVRELVVSSSRIDELRRCPERLLLGNCIGAPSVTIHRRDLGLFYDPRLKWFVDTDFYIRAIRKNPQFGYLSRSLICTFSGGKNRVTHFCRGNPEVELREAGIVWRKCQPITPSVPFGLSLMYFWAFQFAQFHLDSIPQLTSYTGKLPRMIPFLCGGLFLSYPFRLYRRLRYGKRS